MLTTIDHIKEMPGMANNIRDGRIVPYLQEVEDSTLIPAIGAALYERLDSGEEQDDILLNGGYYTNSAGERKMCHGIRKAVSYSAYSVMLMANKVSVTAFGVVEKTSQYSQSASSANTDKTASHYAKMSDYYLQSCLEYIEDKNGCKKPHRKVSRYITMKVVE